MRIIVVKLDAYLLFDELRSNSALCLVLNSMKIAFSLYANLTDLVQSNKLSGSCVEFSSFNEL